MLEAAHFKNLEAIITFCRIIIHFQKRGFVVSPNEAIVNHFFNILLTATEDDDGFYLVADICG